MEYHKDLKKLIALLTHFYPITDTIQVAIESSAEIIHVPKKTLLLQEKSICRSIYFILNGSVRIYHNNPKANETNSWLLLENELIISVYSFFSQKPSFENIETLEECRLIKLSYNQLNQLYNSHLSFNIIGRKLTEHYYIKSEEKAHLLRTFSAQEKYDYVLRNNPEIIKRFSLGHIASYLGITQSTLSRIRNSV